MNDDEELVTTKVSFDGDWEKAAAIDTALTYGSMAIDFQANRIKGQVSGAISIASDDFTLTTSIMESVLDQRGYTVIAKSDVEALNDGAERLVERREKDIETISLLRAGNTELRRQNDALRGDVDRLGAEVDELKRQTSEE